jgi:hypothetical protein
VTVTPAPATYGSAIITLTVNDGVLSAQTSFKVTVNGLRVYLPFIRR